jgi:hypothetical protein
MADAEPIGREEEIALFQVNEGGDLSSIEVPLRHVLKKGAGAVRHLLTPDGDSIVLENGGQIGTDSDKIESRTPASEDAVEHERYRRAGQRNLMLVADAYAAATSSVIRIVPSRASVSYGACSSWGASHLHVGHHCEPHQLQEVLIPLLAAVAPLVGDGGFCPIAPGLVYVRSPRLCLITQSIGSGSQSNRPIYHTKAPSHSAGVRIHHNIIGANNCSETCGVLFAAMLQRAARAADRGGVPTLRLRDNPVSVLHTFNKDIHATVRTSKGQMKAWQVVDHFFPALLEAMPDTNDHFEQIWTRIRDAYQHDRGLPLTLDADIKHAQFGAYLKTRGVTWEQLDAVNEALAERAPEVLVLADNPSKALDYLADPTCGHRVARDAVLGRIEREGDLDTLVRLADLRADVLALDERWSLMNEDGIFNQLDAAGVLDHHVPGVDDIDRAMVEPPSVPRDQVRGAYVKQHAGDETKCATWMYLEDRTQGKVLDISDPCKPSTTWRSSATLKRTRLRRTSDVELRDQIPLLSELLGRAPQGSVSESELPSLRALAWEASV